MRNSLADYLAMKRLLPFSVFSFVCLLSTGCFVPPGQRLLTVQIEQDGTNILESLWAVSDSLTKPEAWKTLVNATLEPVNGWEPAAPSGDNAIVKGEISIQLNLTSNPYIILKTDQLKLVKDKSGKWKLSKETIDKLAQDVK